MPEDLKIVPDPDRSFVPAISVAVLLLITVAIIIFVVNPRQTSNLSVIKIDTYAPHTTFQPTPGAMHVIGSPEAGEDNLYVVARVKLTDKLRLPLFIVNTTATLTNADGSQVTATAISPRYYERIEKTFPKLTDMLGPPIHDGDEVDPGQVEEGCVLFNFPGLTQNDWDTRHTAVLSINLRNQLPQTIQLR